MALNGLWGSFFSRVEGAAMARPFRRGWFSPVSVTVGLTALLLAERAGAMQQQPPVRQAHDRAPGPDLDAPGHAHRLIEHPDSLTHRLQHATPPRPDRTVRDRCTARQVRDCEPPGPGRACNSRTRESANSRTRESAAATTPSTDRLNRLRTSPVRRPRGLRHTPRSRDQETGSVRARQDRRATTSARGPPRPAPARCPRSWRGPR